MLCRPKDLILFALCHEYGDHDDGGLGSSAPNDAVLLHHLLQFGRKVLLLLGGLGMLVSMATSATLILVFRVEEGGSRAVGYIVVAFICFFFFFFAYGWG